MQVEAVFSFGVVVALSSVAAHPNKYPRIKRGREMPLPTGSNVRGRTLRNTGIVLPF